MTLRNALIIFFVLFILSSVFGARLLMYQHLPGFHEYEAAFLYVSDILLVLLLFFIARTKEGIKVRGIDKLPLFFLLFFLISAAVSVAVSSATFLSVFAFLHLILAVSLILIIGNIVQTKGMLKAVLIAVVVAALLQASFGIYQFSTQGPLGLQHLGEPELTPPAGSTSTIRAEGGRFLRAYGTLPHPNVLGAFLTVGLLAASYLYLSRDRELYTWNTVTSVKRNFVRFITHPYFYQRLVLTVVMFTLLFGIGITFSRSAWLAAFIGSILFLIISSAHGFVRGALRLLVVLLAAGVMVSSLLQPLVVPRAQVVRTEQAVNYRLIYAELGSKLVVREPLGVGIGTQVFYSVTNDLYQARGLTKLWQWEPIHNLYLLMASEIGMFGLLSFLAFLGIVSWRLIRTRSLETAMAASLLAAVVVLGLFDHFLWDLQPGRLLLWLTIGIALSALYVKDTSRP